MSFIIPTKKSTITKDIILQKTNNGLEVFKHYILDFKEVGKPFKAAFREEEHPSANVFESTSGEYLYKDFADDTVLNCIDFVKKLKGIDDFNDTLERIHKDLKLFLNKNEVIFEEDSNFDYWYNFAKQTYMDEVIKKYKIKSLKNFSTNSGFNVKVLDTNPAFAFGITSDFYKIYRPLEERKFKHQWVGNKPLSYSNIFGVEQLPKHCSIILITEGLKDCIVANANLNQENIFAIAIDNVSTAIPEHIISSLKVRCDFLVLCLDIDEKGIEGSRKKSEKHGLRNFILPDILRENGGKDISDWFRLKLSRELLVNSLKAILDSLEPTVINKKQAGDSILTTLLKTEELLKINASQDIVFSPPLVEREGFPIFRPGTINIIQGKFGSHKSRIAELFCALMLCKDRSDDFLGFERDYNLSPTVIYIDTERNTKEEFPVAIQSIKNKAGFRINEEVENFRFSSIKTFVRVDRLKAIKAFIESVRNATTSPIFVVLDVSSDCISDFNNIEDAMELFDYLGNLTEEHNATFLLIIHENPNSDKARGHLGTEAGNKASTLIKIGFHGNSQDLIELEFKKLRTAKRPAKLFLTYSEAYKGLILADKTLIATHVSSQGITAEAISNELTNIFVEPTIKQKDLILKLQDKFQISENTLKNRLDEIEQKQLEIFNFRDEPCKLIKQSVSGKATIYELLLSEDLY